MTRVRRRELSGLAGRLEMWMALDQERLQRCFAVSRDHHLPPTCFDRLNDSYTSKRVVPTRPYWHTHVLVRGTNISKLHLGTKDTLVHPDVQYALSK